MKRHDGILGKLGPPRSDVAADLVDAGGNITRNHQSKRSINQYILLYYHAFKNITFHLPPQ